MKFFKTFKFRAYPSPSQEARVSSWMDALRSLWNVAHEQRLLGLNKSASERKFYGAFEQINQLTELRSAFPWLADVPRNACAQVLVELDKAWQRTFKKLARHPKWKKKCDAMSICEPHSKVWRIEDDGVVFPKLGLVRIVQHRRLEGTPKTCVLSRDADQWFVAITVEMTIADVPPRVEPLVAIDVGCVNLVADSDGKKTENPRFLEHSIVRLRRCQRSLARKKKNSKNREKARVRFTRLHRKVRRQRNHVLHEISSSYAKSHGVVVVEKLDVRGMAINKGAYKTSLNRSIYDAGWARFFGFLRYKLALTGGTVVEVPAAYSSQTCSSCGSIDRRSRRSQSDFCCVACGHTEHADLNAAKVLKSRASRSVLPVEGPSLEDARRSRKRLNVPRRPIDSSPRTMTTKTLRIF